MSVTSQSNRSLFLKICNHLGSGVNSAFSIILLILLFSSEPSGWALLFSGLVVGGLVFTGTAAVYRDDPWQKFLEFFYSFPKLRRTKGKYALFNPDVAYTFSEIMGYGASFVKGITAWTALTLSFVSIATAFGAVIPVFSTGFLLLSIPGFFVGVGYFFVQLSKLIPESRYFTDAVEDRDNIGVRVTHVPWHVDMTFKEQLIFWLWKMPAVIGHGMGQAATGLFIFVTIFMFFSPVSALFITAGGLFYLAVASILSIFAGITTGRFYGQDFLGYSYQLNTGHFFDVEKESVIGLWGIILGGGSSFCKGALGFTSLVMTGMKMSGLTIGFSNLVLFAATPVGATVVGIAILVGITTIFVQASKTIPQTSLLGSPWNVFAPEGDHSQSSTVGMMGKGLSPQANLSAKLEPQFDDNYSDFFYGAAYGSGSGYFNQFSGSNPWAASDKVVEAPTIR